MKIERVVQVPTGHIFVSQGRYGLLEFLSIGDYGKDVNLKAQFMGIERDPDPVRHTTLLPLEQKWVVTISTQYGCSIGCTFCDVPKVGTGKNATLLDLQQQVILALQSHPEVRATSRLNVHFARMGEPTFNPAVLDMAKWLKAHIDDTHRVHPVVSTMLPKRNPWLKLFLHTWMRIKNRLYRGNAGLQLSINSTNEAERDEMFNGNALPLADISRMFDGVIPLGRKITLNFPVGPWEIDPDILLKYFDPTRFLIKLTPLHRTQVAVSGGILTQGDPTTYEPYAHHEKVLVTAGYDVIVFIASEEEDSSGITCGNAILAL